VFQSNEVKSSYHMELEGLKRSLSLRESRRGHPNSCNRQTLWHKKVLAWTGKGHWSQIWLLAHGHKYVIEHIGPIETVINSAINDADYDYYYYSDDIRVKTPVISLEQVFSVTRVEVYFWYSIVVCHSLHLSAVHVKFKISDLIWFFKI